MTDRGGVACYRDAYIAAYGETRFHKRADEQLEPLGYLAEAARLTLEAAQVAPSEVDGLAVSSFLMPPDNVCTVAEHLGLAVNWTMHGAQGGATSAIQVMRASEAVERGVCQAVLVLAGDSFDVAAHMNMMDTFNPPVRDYIAPYGFGGPNGLFAMIQRRHMHAYGTRPEQLGRIAVTQRKHAQRNENALLRAPLTLEEYLHARLIAEPLRLFDCVLPCGGGGGVLVTTQEVAARAGHPIRVRAGAERVNHRPADPVMLESGSVAYADALFETAGVTRSDVDHLQLYDDYPIMVAMQLEDLGYCPKGQVGGFLEATDLSVWGKLPVNTGGGQLSCGQAGAAGGMLPLVESVRQLQGDGRERQVAQSVIGLVSGFGMVAYGRGIATGSLILERV